MRTLVCTLILLVLAPLCLAMDIVTRAGVTYRRCEVTAVELECIVVTHADGVTRIPFEELSPALQSKYHYDPEKIAAYRKKLADAKAAAAQKAADELRVQRIHQAELQEQREEEERQLAAAHEKKAAFARSPIGLLAKQWMSLSEEMRAGASMVIFGLGLAICLYLANKYERYRQWKRICAEWDKYWASAKESNSLPLAAANIPLRSGEYAYYSAPASLYETRTVAHTDSSFWGDEIGHGFIVGSSHARTYTAEELTRIDSGTLTMTNRRLVFTGGEAARSIPVEQILAASSTRDSVEVCAENYDRSQVFSAANPLILATIVRVCRGGFAHVLEEPSAPVQEEAGETTTKGLIYRPPNDEAYHAHTLGLSGSFTFEDVKRQYREKIQEYHPDKVAALGAKLRELAEAQSKEINAAYEFFWKKYKEGLGL